VVLLDDGFDFDFDLRSARLFAACTCDDATCALDVLAALPARDPDEGYDADDAAGFFF
jgi:hypothetical protein